MIYNILAIGDIHFGAMDPDTQFHHLFGVIECVRALKDQLDMIVINGDYYDYKLQLNSKSAINALAFFDLLYEAAQYANVKKIRIVKGTKEHDQDQLEAFRTYEMEDQFVKIFTENTIEETLPDLHCIYCPDETINEEEYMELYLPNLMSFPDIGFFHGSFDIVMPDVAVEIAEKTHIQNIIYYFDKWHRLIRGPMISSHWHDAMNYGPLYYIGSYDRWEFGEEGTKGFAIIRMNTETKEFVYTKIANPFSIEYKTFVINTMFYTSHMAYSNMADTIEDYMKENPNAKIRITIKITDDKKENADYIKALQERFANRSRTVKFNIVDYVQRAKKKEKHKSTIDVSSKYQFIFDKSSALAYKIQQFLLTQNQDAVHSIDEINSCIEKYLPKD